MKAVAALVMALLVPGQSLEAECVREGQHKVREILSGVAAAAATSFIARTVIPRPHSYSDYRVEDGIAFSPKYNRRMIVSYALGTTLGIFISTPPGCHSILRPLPGVILPTIGFWSAAEKPFGMIFTSMFLPPFQAASGTLTNGLRR